MSADIIQFRDYEPKKTGRDTFNSSANPTALPTSQSRQNAMLVDRVKGIAPTADPSSDLCGND